MIRFTSVAEAKFSPQFKERVLSVYSLFPELRGQAITCGFICRGHVLGTARSWQKQISLQSSVGNMTIAHELTHLLQGNGVPHGEKACDIWAVARLPAEMLDEQPYYILRHWQKGRWLRNRPAVKGLCAQAIKVRESRRTYIKWLSGQLRQLH
ncbi:hypothetical protein [Nitrososphaera sp.]|uniref:hypothetical protein n=1 Tax=Nitrososphaera sp. TaxID=1971748 RepID=UPI003D6FC622